MWYEYQAASTRIHSFLSLTGLDCVYGLGGYGCVCERKREIFKVTKTFDENMDP